jgi:hypothetical protein
VKGVDGQISWHLAPCCGYEEVLENLWVWAGKVHLNLKDDVFLCKSNYGQTAWQLAVQQGYKDLL